MTSSLASTGAPDSAAPRRCVYIDASALTALEQPADRRLESHRVLAPGAADSVQLLVEGHDVVVLGGEDLDGLAGLGAARHEGTMPSDFPSGSWYLTADETWCEGERPNGLRSILVGPRRPPTKRPTLRCDIEARDLTAAVMEILVRETMA